MVTCSDNNTEMKIWCCSTWQCLQTIHFKSPIGSELILKAEIDRTASYLVLSDVKNRSLYVLEIQKEIDDNYCSSNLVRSAVLANKIKKEQLNVSTPNKEDAELSIAFVKSISEFPLSSPILSFDIVDASVREYKCSFNESYTMEELEDELDENNQSMYCVVIHLFLVQPKSLQECHVLYQPTIDDLIADISPLTEDSVNILAAVENKKPTNGDGGNLMKPISSPSSALLSALSVAPVLSPKSTETNSIHMQKPSSQINLLTPDSFHSPG